MKTFALGLIIIGSVIGLLNWGSGLNALIKEGSTSFLPYIGGIICLGGVYLHPTLNLSYYWWVALIIDFTLLPLILVLACQTARNIGRHENT
ncbi:hypothetical protein [Microbulbifer sp. VAAF005]|uniref:hypothetical protein n=1 Tax=Microbulbifer sp. VAAF005 TaxID=3034230 RepID=UPI0024AD646F|nr:hypothetical protein [Microbulbifer sp. VAAF005]WHI48431.1 hypothetical protein P0078_08680 [Microbulbifer sp. VAAF005]